MPPLTPSAPAEPPSPPPPPPLTGGRRTARGRRARRARLAAATLLASSASFGLLLSAPVPAEAGSNLVVNPGFEALRSNGEPTCWQKSGWGDNDFTYATTGDAHSGKRAMSVTLTRRVSGDRKALMLEDTSCAPNVTSSHQYDLSLWYKSTTPDASVTVFRHDVKDGWQYWTDLKTLPVSSGYTRAEVRTPVVPPGTDQITWGVSVYGTGTVTTDDFAMEDATQPAPGDVCTAGEACAKGSWAVMPFKNPVRSMHSVVLHNGKVLLVAGSGNDPELFKAGTFTSAVYDPKTGGMKTIPTPVDMFCAGHVQLSDGRVLIMSGNKAYPAADGSHGYEGFKDSYLFDPSSETYTRTNDLNDGHWYPSATLLGNGDVITFGGLREDSTGSVTAERFSQAQQKWLPMNQVNQTWSYWGLYPSMILMQDGRLFYSGSHVFGNGTPGTGASVYDYDRNTVTDVPGLQDKDHRDQSASVLLPPAQDQRVLTMGGGNVNTNPEANRFTDIIDLKKPTPRYAPGPLIPQGTVDQGQGRKPQTGAQGKMYVSAVLMPDGKVLETGGGLHDRADPVFEASMFNPAANTFQSGLATDPIPRTYHSSAFLLPDGRVMAVGDNPGNGSFDDHVSIYTPPYLYKGARPQITSVATDKWQYASTQRVTVDRPIVKAELIRPAAVTHSSDPNQRFVDLPMTVGADGTTIDLNVTSNPNLAPPGWYMLYAVDAAGVPSVATWVRLGGPEAMAPAAAPMVHDFASKMPASAAKKPQEKHTSKTVDTQIAGCDRHYGTENVCVPTKFPKSVPSTTAGRCAWLTSHGYKDLKVNGKDDPLGLDPDRNGRACG
ncbi:Galactose oxidase [Streptomyces albireticuli]|uniref:Galactose oxidase n=1 Tax=Streptomyces albireticuli TaxID=1940 RepID=A0A1Z2L7A7_9ACTN|nr:galactose oxidase early set domain-containing protein [Streptomyces albireticuli]ARZ70196.1 Galactose oxidase [Streptomyces albireticuli]